MQATLPGQFGGRLERGLRPRDDDRLRRGEARVTGLRRLVRGGSQMLAAPRPADRSGSARGWPARRRRCSGRAPSARSRSPPDRRPARPRSGGSRPWPDAAAAASRPPLIAERCLRTAFIWAMSAPEASSARFTARLSSSESPGAGSASRAEAPPEIRQSTRSSAPAPWARARMRSAASRPAASGTGCAASTTSICAQGTRMAVAGDHEPLERAGHVPLDRLRHGGRRLARAEDDRPPARRGGQVGQERARGRRDLDRGIEQFAQTRLAFDHPLWRTHGSGPATAAADPG